MSRTIRGIAGGTEWDLLFDSTAIEAFPDVRRPLDGPVEPTPESVQRECREAKRYGIDAFIFCWYWDRAELRFGDTLQLFLQAPIPPGFRYALMWVNKRPHYVLPLLTPPKPAVERIVPTDEVDFRLMIEHLVEHHWSRPEYLALDGRPVFLVFHVEFLLDQCGAGGLRRLLALGDEVAVRAGFPGIEYVAITHRPQRVWHSVAANGIRQRKATVPLAAVGFRAISNYVYLPDWSGPPVQDYRALIAKRAAEWSVLARLHRLPLWPSLSPGWDGRPRGSPQKRSPSAYPWQPRVTGETPAAFAGALELWQDYATRSGVPPVLPLASWNEWSEGHAIAPCDRHGDGMLRALQDFKRSFQDGAASARRAHAAQP